MDLSRWAGQTVRLRSRRPTIEGRSGSAWTTSASSGSARTATTASSSSTRRGLECPRPRPAQADRGRRATALSARREASRGDFSGAVLVAREGEPLLEDAWGRADRAALPPNTPETKFRIGSMNKMFTAVATLQLVEAGKVALDDTIGKHLPDYPNKDVASKVTVRHLLRTPAARATSSARSSSRTA